MIYDEGKSPGEDNLRASYEGTITVVPNLRYELKVEVLRNDLGRKDEKVSDITMNGVIIGGCNPDGDDYDCTFYDCTSSLKQTTIFSHTASIKASLHFRGHSRDCDCDKNTWECSKEDTKPHFTPMKAVARITLSPIGGTSSGNRGEIFFR